jgi:hypothetical protein
MPLVGFEPMISTFELPQTACKTYYTILKYYYYDTMQIGWSLPTFRKNTSLPSLREENEAVKKRETADFQHDLLVIPEDGDVIFLQIVGGHLAFTLTSTRISYPIW